MIDIPYVMYSIFYVFHHYFLKNSVPKYNDSDSIWSHSWNLVIVFMSFFFNFFKSCLHADMTSWLNADRTSCLYTDRTSCLHADRTSCLYTDRTSCLYADRTSCLHADRTSYPYPDRTSCLYADRTSWLYFTFHAYTMTLLHSWFSYCLFVLPFLSPAKQSLYFTDLL